MKLQVSLSFLGLMFVLLQCNVKPYIAQPMKNLESILSKDTAVEWVLKDKKEASTELSYSYTHKGDTTENWVELYKRSALVSMMRIDDKKMEKFIAQKEAEVNQYDGVTSFSKETIGGDDRTYFIEYEIKKLNELGMIIVFSEFDGIYFQSWQYRSASKDKARINMWKKWLKSSRTKMNEEFKAL